MRRLLPLLFPLSLLLIGSWRLSVNSEPPIVLPAPARPDLTVSPAGEFTTCHQDPSIDQELLREGQRLGVTVVPGEPELPGKDATYRAEHGHLGTITLRQRPMSDEVRCLLISHEFIHVLQHLHGDLNGVPPLGWPTRHPDPVVQEAEAYGHQNRAGYVLQLLEATPAPR